MSNKDHTISNNRIFLYYGLLVLCIVFLIYDIYGYLQGDNNELYSGLAALLGIASMVILIVKCRKTSES